MEELQQQIEKLEQINNTLQEEVLNLHKDLNEMYNTLSNFIDDFDNRSTVTQYSQVNLANVLEDPLLGDDPDERLQFFLDMASKHKILFINN